MKEVRLSPDLPEHFTSLYDLGQSKFRTPLDSRGIADIDQVFELAIRTYPYTLPDFGRAERNRHHLYWTEEWWKGFAASQATPEDQITVSTFRNSAPQVAYVPLDIHKWIEDSQIPPPAPDIEVMRRRNAGWMSATILLKSARELDQARQQYGENKVKVRRLLGSIVGITPLSKQSPDLFIDVLDTEYWLSELSARLEGWRNLAAAQSGEPTEQGFLPTIRLSDVRNLRSRVREDAMIPKLPPIALAA